MDYYMYYSVLTKPSPLGNPFLSIQVCCLAYGNIVNANVGIVNDITRCSCADLEEKPSQRE